MGNFIKSTLAAAVLVAVPVTSVQAACWSESAISAAKVRDMETMLMVSALRCRNANPNILPAYNAFVRSSRVALTKVNNTLRRQFADQGGLNGYDRYVTSIANRYGAGAEGLSCDDMSSILSAAQSESGSLAGLARLAAAANVEPVLTDRRCPVVVAARK
jgi:hypothetical protein